MNCTDLKLLAACRPMLADPVVEAACAAFGPAASNAEKAELASRVIERAESLGLGGNLLRACLIHLLGDGGNAAARAVQTAGQWGAGIERALAADMAILLPLLEARTSELTGMDWLDDYQPSRPARDEYDARLGASLAAAQGSPQRAALALLEHYKKFGSGTIARHTAFLVSDLGELEGIANFPAFDWDDLLGYEHQKEKLMRNAIDFVEGRPYNNVLLTGARGTGKSTCVRSLVSRLAGSGLRLVQLTRGQLELLAPVMEKLGKIRNGKFILFFDDLSFDEGEHEYKFLKSAIDGSVTPQPENVMICATSNRRHLLKESWNDRSDSMEEVYRQDSANESISLSDRFGLILHYHMPSQEEYLRIIDHGLRKGGVILNPERLRIEGVRWEMEHSGRNGRIAAQFVRAYLGSHLPGGSSAEGI